VYGSSNGSRVESDKPHSSGFKQILFFHGIDQTKVSKGAQMHMQRTSGRTFLRKGRNRFLALVTAGSLLLGACNVDPGQLSGSALADTIFLPIVSGANSGAAEAAQPQNGDIIPGQYIVVFKEDQVLASSVAAVSAEMTVEYNGAVVENYDAALAGFAARFPAETSDAAVAALQQDSRVAYVEPDRVITLDPMEELTTTVRAETTVAGDTATVGAAAVDTVQVSATWGLDRIDQRALPLNAQYKYATTGSGVRAYIIDTGIRITHSEFGGRASWGTNTVGDGKNTDCNGHGTHVAGTVGGATYGMAKGVSLIAVKVLSCGGSGQYSGVIAGVDWVTARKREAPTVPMVANMSLGGGATSALDAAVRNSIAAGVVYVLAAGNNNMNACNTSPARTAEAITVGATMNTDGRASFSNFGTCLDLFAPGVNITAPWSTNDTATNTASGTSMAAPHVAGAVARYLQSNPTASPLAVRNALVNSAIPNVVSNPGSGSPNVLLYVAPPPYFAAPVALLANWYTPASGWTATNHPRLVGDVNGDRKVDIVGFAEDGTYLSLGTGSSFPAGTKVLASFGLNAGSWTQQHPRVLGDVNGDGKADIVGFGQDGVYVAFSTGAGFQNPVFTLANFAVNAGGWTLDQPRTVGDVNGDGKADLVGFGKDGVLVAFSTGTTFQAPILTVASFGLNVGNWTQDHPRTVGDVNGDGKADLVGFGNDGVAVAFSTGNGFQAPVFTVNNYGLNAGNWSATNHPRRVADINGDGKADLVGFGNDGIFVSLSTGTGFTKPELSLNAYTVNGGGWTSNHLRLLGDVNGDGMADIVGFGETGISTALATP